MSHSESMTSGIENLDRLLGGGFPRYSLTILAGEPGTGKTILAQNVLFNHIRTHPESKAVYISTLSEPITNVIRYMQRFDFFEADVFGERVIYQDLGDPLRQGKLDEVLENVLELAQKHEAQVLVIDSFKAINEMTSSPAAFRRFCFDIALRLSSMRCTVFFVGEYERTDVAEAPEFAVADAILYLSLEMVNGESQRLMHVLKVRGQNPVTRPTPFAIGNRGVRVLDGLQNIRRTFPEQNEHRGEFPTRVEGLDVLLRGGIPCGKTVLISGASGTGKTTLCLQIVIRAAEAGERSLYFSFEEPVEHLVKHAASFGMDLQRWMDEGLVRVLYTHTTDIRLEEGLEAIARELREFEPACFVVDSSSVFMHRIENPSTQREKIWQFGQLAQGSGAVGLLVADIPAGGTGRLSRFGVEETLADGVIVLSSGLSRGLLMRHIELYKMRNKAIKGGKHYMEIGPSGIEVFHFEPQASEAESGEKALVFEPVRQLVTGNLNYGSSWLCRGEPGVGKSVMAGQFALEGLKLGESALIVSVDEPAAQALKSFRLTDDATRNWLESGRLAVLDAFLPGGPDFRNWEAFIYAIARAARNMEPPLRIILDSLAPVQAVYGDTFFDLVYQKNRLLRQAGIVLLDTAPRPPSNENDQAALTDFYDLVLDLFTPDWGDMRSSGSASLRALQIPKARGVTVDTQPYPYTITATEGIVIQTDFYGTQRK